MGIDKYIGNVNKGHAWACNFIGLVSFGNGVNNNFKMIILIKI